MKIFKLIVCAMLIALTMQTGYFALLYKASTATGAFLIVCGITRHQDALVPAFQPLLSCDVWEHAYYLTWKNNRKGYIEAFMRHINWRFVSQFYENLV